MPVSGNAWQQSIRAAESAGRLLDELGIEQTQQVDVFSMCETLGLWLTFLPMDGLLGAFVPEGAGGVLITDRRPITVQRYTAAHEIGHWRLEHGHGLALDGEEHVFGVTRVERERLAQVFAASLLMPPPLVFSLLTRIGIGERGRVGPKDAYFIAREVGVSYEAAVRQLTNLRVITPANATSLLGVRPLTLKTELAGGRRPVYGYADVWPVDELWNNQQLSLRADDEVVVSLPENRSTGYRWMFDDEAVSVVPSPEPPRVTVAPADTVSPADLDRFLQAARKARPGRAPGVAVDRARKVAYTSDTGAERVLPGGVAIVGDDYIPGRSPMLQAREARRLRLDLAAGKDLPVSTKEISGPVGAGDRPASTAEREVRIAATGRRLIGVRFVDAGAKTVRLQHRSPYSQAPAIEEYVLHAMVEPRRHGFSIDQLFGGPDEPWVGEVRSRKLYAATDRNDEPEPG